MLNTNITHPTVDLDEVKNYLSKIRRHITNKDSDSVKTCVNLLFKLYEEEIVDQFIKQLQCDQLTQFEKGMP